MSEIDLDERAANAKAILNNPAFKEAVLATKDHYIAVLESEPVGSLLAATAHASMKVLGDVEQRLKLFVSEANNRKRG
jgi:hypothetical protein